MIREYLQKNAGIKNKSLEEQKRIIQTFVKKMIVYENTVDVVTVVTLVGGAKKPLYEYEPDEHQGFAWLFFG